MYKPVPHLTDRQRQRFWSKVDQTDRCWTWQGYRDPNGYCFFTIGRVKYKACLVAYQLSTKDLPPGLSLGPGCGTQECVNPIHMRFWGFNREPKK